MIPLIGGGKFEDIGDKIRLPDDVTMGYVAEHLLGVPLTVISDFHSHMEPHKALPGHDSRLLAEGISYSYVLKEDPVMSNVLEIPNGLPLEEDPTRYVLFYFIYFQKENKCDWLNHFLRNILMYFQVSYNQVLITDIF